MSFHQEEHIFYIMSISRVAIIIVNWNGIDDTRRCLESLKTDLYESKIIYVVDNGSIDGSASILRGEFPDVRLIESGENRGFSGGNNLGIEAAIKGGCDFIFLLNNDTSVEPNALSRLVKVAEENPQLGQISPLIFYASEPQKVWFGNSRLDLQRGIAVHDQISAAQECKAWFEVPWVTGCAVLMPMPLLERLGGLDERYFLYWEDVALSLQTRESGYQVVVVPCAKIFHSYARSSQKINFSAYYYHLRNNLLLVSSFPPPQFGGKFRVQLAVVLRAVREECRLQRQWWRARNFEEARQHRRMGWRALRDHFFFKRYGPLREKTGKP